MLLPLKQGLKQHVFERVFHHQGVVMLLPLKQGLKPLSPEMSDGAILLLCYFH